MERDHQDYHSMVRSVLLCFTQHEDAAATPPMLATLRGALTDKEASLSTERRRQGDPIAGLAENKELLQKQMVFWVQAGAGMALSYAGFTGNAELARGLKDSNSDLLNLADLDSRNRCQTLLETISTAPLRATLTPYGLTDEILEKSDDLVDEFSALIGKPRQLIVERSGATTRIATGVTDLRHFLDAVLDSFMRQYGLPVNTPEGLARQALYAAYNSARIIVNQAGGRRPAPEATTAGNPA